MFRIKNSRINPQKSNKMIWAVGIGLLLVFAGYMSVISIRKPVKSEVDEVNRTLSYLRQAKNIVKWEWKPAERLVKIVYTPDINGDIVRVAHYAALRLAGKIEEFILEVERTQPPGAEYRIEVNGGRIIAETDLKKVD